MTQKNAISIVLGMHRSGTSAVSKYVHSLFPSSEATLLEARGDNPEGFWEDLDILDLNIKILNHLNSDWDSLDSPVFSKSMLKQLDLQFGDETRLLLGRKLDINQNWVFKDPRTTKLLPFWVDQLTKAGLNYKLVLCNRKPLAIAHSLKTRNNLALEHGLILYTLYIQTALPIVFDNDFYIVNYEALFNKGDPQLEELAIFLGKSDEESKLSSKKFIDVHLKSELNHHAKHRNNKLLPSIPDKWYQLVLNIKSKSQSRSEILAKFEAYVLMATTTQEVGRLAQSYFDAAQQFESRAKLDESVLENTQLEVSQLESYLEDKNKSLAIQKMKINELESSHLEHTQWQEKQVVAIQALEAECKKLDSHNQSLKIEEEKLTGDVKALKVDLDGVQATSDATASELAVLGKEYAYLQQENEKSYKLVLDELRVLGTEYETLHQANEQNIQDHLGEIAQLKSELSKETLIRKAEVTDLEGHLKVSEEHRAALQLQVFAVEKEVGRIWEIVEKHRIAHEHTQAELANVYNSISWRLTKPLRILNKLVTKEIPSFFLRAIRFSVRMMLAIFPKSMRVNERIHLIKERLRAGMRGEADSLSNKSSLHGLFKNRQSVTNLLASPRIEKRKLPRIDLSIVSYNNGTYISAFLDSLLEQDYPLEKICIVVVDNNSSDNTVEQWRTQIEKYKSKFHSFDLYERQNNGFGAGHDFAIKSTDSEYVLVTNIDLEFTSATIVNLLSFAMSDSDNTASWEVRQKPYEHPKFYDPVSLETSWSSHACILLNRRAYLDVGGYEHNIFMYGEDVELSYRFRDRGYILKYVPSSVVFHYTYAEANEFKPLQFFGSTLANTFIRLRYGTLSNVLNIIPMYVGLLRSLEGQQDIRKDVIRKNIAKIPFMTLRSLGSRKVSNRSFSFFGWDYELCRDGAFYEQEDKSRTLPLVSIIVRTYPGREYWLRECLCTLLNQTYENIEIIVVEDGGDSHEKLIEAFSLQYPLAVFVYRPLPKNGRCYSANVALELSKGRYIGFLDDDDLFFSDHVEVCVNEIEDDDTLGAVYTLAWEVETKLMGKTLEEGYEEVSHKTEAALRTGFDREVLKIHNLFPIQAVLFRRELYEKYGGLDLELDNLEDWNLWLRYSSQDEFKLIEKTTSMFRTPHKIKDRMQRQKILDEYLPVARQKNQSFLDSISST